MPLPIPDQQPDTPVTRTNLAATETRILDATRPIRREMQTEILRGLERFARGNFARMHRLEVSDQDLAERINDPARYGRERSPLGRS